LDAALTQLGENRQPELGALGALKPQAQHVALAVGVDADRQVAGVVRDRLAVADLDHQGVEVGDRVDGLQRAGLPRLGVLEDRVGDLGDQVGADVGAIDLAQVALDLADRQPAGIERDHLVVKADPARLALAHDLGLERPVAVPRRADPHRPRVGQDRLGRLAVARVAGTARRRLPGQIAQMVGQLGRQRALQQPPGELAQQPVGARDLLGALRAAQQLVDQLIRQLTTLDQAAARQPRQGARRRRGAGAELRSPSAGSLRSTPARASISSISSILLMWFFVGMTLLFVHAYTAPLTLPVHHQSERRPDHARLRSAAATTPFFGRTNPLPSNTRTV
jgi:hypothetical protein